jgi:O-antigen biosynthesis protein
MIFQTGSQRLRKWAKSFLGPGGLTPLGKGWLPFIRQSMRMIFESGMRRQAIRNETPSVAAYQAWLTENEPSASELIVQRQTAQALTYRPLISLLTPVYNPSPQALREALESVLAQTYEHWELCVVDGKSDVPAVRHILEEFANRDPRIRVIFAEENRGIAGNSNLALQSAQGEFVALLDHDDVLAPFALYEVVQQLNQDQAWDLLYSDHDLLAADGTYRFHPLFKPDWSPEILLSANYLTHLTVLRTALVREVGGFDPATDGAQDWDLFLRFTERTQRVAHIPKVLYHWRAGAQSTATNIWVKPYAPEVQLRIIEKHLTRQQLRDARATFDPSGFIRVNWAQPRDRRVSIVIPSRGSNPWLEACLNSLLEKTAYSNFEVLVINNGPQLPTAFEFYRRLAHNPRVRILHSDAPFNYSAVNNFGALQAQGDIFLFLNNDTEVIRADWLDELVQWVERPEVGVVGAHLLQPDGIIQHAGVIVGLTGFAGHVFAGSREGQDSPYGFTGWYRDFLAVTGACLMVRREVFEQVGGFQEEFQLCGSDVEFCLRVRALGYRIVCNPFAQLRHAESATHHGAIPAQDFTVSLKYYEPVLGAGDPYYNPNLSPWQLFPALSQKADPRPLDFAVNFTRSKGQGNHDAVV